MRGRPRGQTKVDRSAFIHVHPWLKLFGFPCRPCVPWAGREGVDRARGLFADNGHHHVPMMRVSTMLPQKDTLPRAEQETSLVKRDRFAGSG